MLVLAVCLLVEVNFYVLAAALYLLIETADLTVYR